MLELFNHQIKAITHSDNQLLPFNYRIFFTILDSLTFITLQFFCCVIESYLTPPELLSKRIIVTISQSINIITSNMTTILIPPIKTTSQAELIEIDDSPSQLPSLFDQLIAEYTYHSLEDQQYSTPIQATEESSSHELSQTLETQDVSVEKAVNEITRIEEEANTSNDDHDSIQKLPTLSPKVKRPRLKKSHQRVSKVNPFSPQVEEKSAEVQPQKSKKIVKAARMVLQPFWSFSWNILGSS